MPNQTIIYVIVRVLDPINATETQEFQTTLSHHFLPSQINWNWLELERNDLAQARVVTLFFFLPELVSRSQIAFSSFIFGCFLPIRSGYSLRETILEQPGSFSLQLAGTMTGGYVVSHQIWPYLIIRLLRSLFSLHKKVVQQTPMIKMAIDDYFIRVI